MTTPRLSASGGILGLCALLTLSACFGPPSPAPSPSPTTSSPTTTATPTATATATASPTSPAATSSPAATPPPSSVPAEPTAAPPAPGLPEQEAPLTIYYVAIDDGGVSGPLIGCGDSLVATTTAPVKFTDQVRPSIETLLANKSRDVGLSGLVNVLYQSNLTYMGGELNGSTITIHLHGQFMLGGVCDIPRAKAQLEYTAMTASGATSARVFVNGRPLDEVLSLK
ncbi:GerMN domain-containing protein [Pseudarthrobacter phenanthrenivorans]|uniref:GerMN domain-containing protein n=1 Tax=Pseudarthrobacter phenanthrenivorans TaxID=361575 RepID=UPI0016021535|nr:GerMN domain-containing protein [Pseudarthrobacter phenanthrenivorans]